MPLTFSENPRTGLRLATNTATVGLKVTSNPAVRLAVVGLAEATLAEALEGTSQNRYMSPLRVAQAIDAEFTAEATGDLTRVDDTNVTLTLGGTPTNALFESVSLTMGWTGTLAASRLNSSVVQSVVNDTNVTGSIAAQALTLGWTGTLAVARGGTGGSAASGTLLDNITGFSSTGMLARTASGTYAFRTITGTSNQITVSNGDGVSGNPTLSLPSDVIIPTVLTAPNTGLHILDTNASHDLIIVPGSDLTADRNLTLTTGDAARTITINGDPTLNDWFDQAVKTTSTPTFAQVTVGNGHFGFIAYKITSVNFNSANTDNAITITLPSGYSRFQVSNVFISHASGTLTTSTFGVFTATGGGGTALVASGTACTITTASEGTNNNAMNCTIAVTGAQSFNVSTVYFRVQTPQGSAATADVTLDIRPLS